MRIAVFEAGEREHAAFRHLGDRHALSFAAGPLTTANAHEAGGAGIISTFMASSLNRVVLEQLPALELIATRSTGFDHIDLDYCRRRGIAVCNVPAYGEVTVAEHAFALLLAISHRIIAAVEQGKTRFSPAGLEGFDLYEKTLGVIGTGSIGRHVIRIARGFGMKVIAHDIAPDENAARELGFAYVPLEALLSSADIISLHVPATEQTRHLLSRQAFDAMKPGVILINTARGSVIDSSALIAALKSGKVAWAGLDVLPAEPLLRLGAKVPAERREDPDLAAARTLLSMPNAIVTPHSAFNTREALDRIMQTTAGNIENFVAGRPVNIVA
jgi:D-lactate dehydrogenase